jgi:uncharacterized protein (DUF885 family)
LAGSSHQLLGSASVFWRREAARQQAGDTFDLKSFHARALNLGPMGLGQLRRELAGA